MKYKSLLLVGLTVSAFGAQANFMQGLVDGCAFGVSTQNAMGDVEKVKALCTQCVTNTPLPGVDKTDQVILSISNECSKKYFADRAKK